MGELSIHQKTRLLTFIDDHWSDFVAHIVEYDDKAKAWADRDAVEIMAALEYEIDSEDE